MAQDSPTRLGDPRDADPDPCRCDFVSQPWHAEMLELERNGTFVGWALGCFEEDMGWEPADLVAFIRQHNWADPASMEDLARRIGFLAERLPSRTGHRTDQRSDSRTVVVSMQITMTSSAEGDH